MGNFKGYIYAALQRKYHASTAYLSENCDERKIYEVVLKMGDLNQSINIWENILQFF